MKKANKKPKQKDILILGIETSADDTGAAIVKNGRTILSNVRSSQEEIHNKYGGIVPEVASRMHIEAIAAVVKEAIEKAGIKEEKIDKVAVTVSPGLKPALLVGQSYAQGFSLGLNKPLIEVNHLFGHMYANFLTHSDIDSEIPKFPLLTLLVSGGHTQLIFSKNHKNQKIIGETLDDAAGEAFDKVARILNLGYPGGPIIDNLSREGIEDAIEFPRPMLDSEDNNFSFSGLKTAVKNYYEKESKKYLGKKIESNKEVKEVLHENSLADIVASFQEAVVDVLVEKAIAAAEAMQIENIALAGGVAANSRLRDVLGRRCHQEGIRLFYPPLDLCVDNAAMIAGAAYHLD